MSKPIRMPQADEQIVLDDLRVEWVKVEELPRFQSLLRRPHYLGGSSRWGNGSMTWPPGEASGWPCWCFARAAKHWRHREQWIGWTEDQRRKRLGLVANNARFLVLPHAHYPNLATRAMGLCLARLPEDWRARSGPPVFLAESFVDTPLFRGTADKASGWTELGPTQGYGRCGQDYYVKQDRPKALFVKELRPKARRSLYVEHLPAVLALAVESKVPPTPTLRAGELRSLRAPFAAGPDFRGRVESYPLRSALAMVACAPLCGAPRGQRDLQACARCFTPAQRRALGVRRDRKTGRYPSPRKATFGRGLPAVDPLRVAAALWDWQAQVPGPAPSDQWLGAEGKELRHGQGAPVVPLAHPKSQYYRGSQLVETKSNEIPAVRPLLERVEVAGSLIGIDARHPQQETARQIVPEAGADYLMTVKAHQKELRQTLAQRRPKAEPLFSPSGVVAAPWGAPWPAEKPGPK